MAYKDVSTCWRLKDLLDPSSYLCCGDFFLRPFVKNVLKFDIPENKLSAAKVSFRYSYAKRAADINILMEHDFISLHFSLREIAKDWLARHYRVEHETYVYLNHFDLLKDDELLDEINITFLDVKNWLLQCINSPEAKHCSEPREFLELIEKSASSNVFINDLLIAFDDVLDVVMDKYFSGAMKILGKLMELKKKIAGADLSSGSSLMEAAAKNLNVGAVKSLLAHGVRPDYAEVDERPRNKACRTCGHIVDMRVDYCPSCGCIFPVSERYEIQCRTDLEL
ncbi:MAG: hypothetical protein IJG51_10975 [Synergistaceae bacterium]|nr:hypothetical protein [Synergistaceae bacterium]MBQ3399399.1 hypothetical protein [Synergistaceae bacterium]MBQ3758547.1 hypothetical protein [Synergistaceae bacterium]MBQ6001740.1 hypothetical protein [Synergistaceae bacterium]MBQ6664347.1 hypothetical protein [Synergistaceae bacterium]